MEPNINNQSEIQKRLEINKKEIYKLYIENEKIKDMFEKTHTKNL